MGDEISDSDRALIDEAIAAGRVTRVPAGKRAITLDAMVYDERSGKLRFADAAKAKKRLINGIKWGRGKRLKD